MAVRTQHVTTRSPRYSLGPGADLPIARLVDENQTAGMTQYVLASVLRYHRQLDVYARLQAERVWRELPHVDACDRRVGILGMGVLGTDAAIALNRLGFDVAGWSRTPKGVPGVASHHGAAGLPALLARTDILVCLLPLTPATEGILCRELFEQLPRGAWLVNAGRGRHLVEEDLLAALDEGLIAGATLDVCRDEPLPPHHRLWSHPKITLTPHIATSATPRTAAAQIAENVRRAREGLALKNQIDRAAGY
jgi:glyoxylate/hydroxypyruvate reductase A